MAYKLPPLGYTPVSSVPDPECIFNLRLETHKYGGLPVCLILHHFVQGTGAYEGCPGTNPLWILGDISIIATLHGEEGDRGYSSCVPKGERTGLEDRWPRFKAQPRHLICGQATKPL